MKQPKFSFPMRTSEKIIGWIYLPIHIFVLPQLLELAYVRFLQPSGASLSNAQINVIFYGFGFAFLFIFLFRFLKASFSDLCDNIWRTVKTVIFGYLLYYVLLFAVNALVAALTKQPINPNSELIINETKLNPKTMTAVAVLLAPFVEEILFRGIAFGTIRRRSRFLAWVVSIVLFSVYHLWQFMLGGIDWTLLIYMLQYVPGAIMLAWSYERGGNIWAPIFLHMLINLISISFHIG